VLGPVEVTSVDRGPVALGGQRQVTLLAMLAAETSRVVPTSLLITVLWPDEIPQRPESALHNRVFRLRRAIGAAGLTIERRGPGYLLPVRPADTDALVFEAAAGQLPADGGDPDRLHRLADEALGLWRGEPFLGLHHVPSLRHAARRLTETRLELLERLASRLLDRDDPVSAIPYLRRAVAEAPLRERPTILLIRALAAAGQVEAAQEHFHGYRQLRAEQIGLDPSAQIQAEYRALLQPPDSGPPQERATEPRTTFTPVPEPLSPIVGRERELDDLGELISRGHRLITLTGPGGVGKTRLAVELARRKWDGNAAFADLSVVTSVEDVPEAFARALGASLASADPAVDLRAAVCAQDLLLVVDNVEQVRSATSVLLAVLSHCGGMIAVVTCREPLDTPGETEFPVGPLAVPTDQAPAPDVRACPAVILFLDRVAGRPVLAGGDQAGTTVRIGQLCRELGGLPLAIELAAALVRSRPVEEVFGSLLRVLTNDPGSGQAMALRAALLWGYDRLGSSHRRVLRRLCVFAGPFDQVAAAAICPDEVDLDLAIERLTVLGVLAVRRHEAGVRYFLPRIIAEYLARHEPAEAGDATQAHFQYHAGLCRDPQWLDTDLFGRIDVAHADVVAALRRGVDERLDDRATHDLATAMLLYWFRRGHLREALRWSERITARFAQRPELLARPRIVLAGVLRELGELAAADLLGDDAEWLVTAYGALAALADDRAEAQQFVRWTSAAVEVAQERAPRRLTDGIDTYQVNLGWAYLATGDHDASLRSFRAFLAGGEGDDQWRWTVEAVAGCACALLHLGRTRPAALALGGTEQLLERLDIPVTPWTRRQLDAAYAQLVQRPDGAELVRAGAQLDLPALVALVVDRP